MHSAEILNGVNFLLAVLCQPDEPPCLGLVAEEGTTLAVFASFARWRVLQNSSLATGCTVATVDSVGNVN